MVVSMPGISNAKLKIFLNTVFFVLGFSVVFAVLGVLLNSFLVGVSYDLRIWVGRIGGVIIILFALYILGLLKIGFLQREHKIRPTKLSAGYLTSFIFGATFAAGWTPCVGAILGAILTLAATQPGSAFFLLLSYSFGLSLPFLLAGAFISQATSFIEKATPYLKYFNLAAGVLLLVLGVLVFTDNLSQIANFFYAQGFFGFDTMNELGEGGNPTLVIAFIGGVISFFSPCILPLVPAFLSYISGVSFKEIQH